MPIIPESQTFDQRTMRLLVEHDPVVQRYRTFFALFEWSAVPDLPLDPSRPGKRPHPQSAYVKALLLKIEEGFKHCTQLRRFLVEHPLLVLELGFRPILDVRAPYGFDVERTVPTARWLCFDVPGLLPLSGVGNSFNRSFALSSSSTCRAWT